jgi:hypothetical protein
MRRRCVSSFGYRSVHRCRERCPPHQHITTTAHHPPTTFQPNPSSRDIAINSHVDFVGVLFVIWGLLTTLVGVSTLALGIGAVALIMSASRGGGGGQMAAGMTAAVFTTLAAIAIVWGMAHVVVGVPVRRHRAWGRFAALMLGAVDLLLLPYGTALGVYALWVLLSERGKALFVEEGTNLKPET